jgi:hypothetical protein
MNCGWRWRFERLSFAYFSLPLQRKVGAAPHRGNPGRPKRLQEKAKTAKTPDQKAQISDTTHAAQRAQYNRHRHQAKTNTPPYPSFLIKASNATA